MQFFDLEHCNDHNDKFDVYFLTLSLIARCERQKKAEGQRVKIFFEGAIIMHLSFFLRDVYKTFVLYVKLKEYLVKMRMLLQK